MLRRKLTAVLSAALGLVMTLVFMASPAGAATAVPAISPGLTVVNLLNINDFHGRIDDQGAFACTLETTKTKLGDSSTVFLSAGDNIGASPFVSSSQQDTPTIQYLSALGLKASAVGNHEFDRGFADLNLRVIPSAGYKHLGANVYAKGTTNPVLPEYEVITVNGIRIGIIGAVTEQTATLVSPAGIENIEFGDPVDAVNRVADQLTDGNAENGEADIIVAEYHDGANGGGTLADETAASPVYNRIVTGTSSKVSVIYNGHTHMTYLHQAPVPAPGTGTRSVSQSASYGTMIGQVQLGIDPTTKQVVEYQATNVPVTPASGACLQDPDYIEARRIADKAIADAKVIGNQVIGSITADITTAHLNGRRDDRLRESTLGNLTAQVWKEAMNAPGRPGADIGIMNSGGLRDELLYNRSVAGEAPGQLTYSEVAAVHPFANTMMTINITGAQFKTLLEQQWQPAGASRPFLKLGLSDNVTYTYDQNRPAGSRITSITYDGAPLDPAANLRIASGSFLITGGDNFTVLKQGTNPTDTGLIDTDVFIDYFKVNSPVSPSYQKQAVAVIDQPTVVEPDGTFFYVEGTDLSSLGAPANTTLRVLLDGVEVQSTPIASGRLPGVPTRDGHADVALRLTDAQATPGPHTVTLVAEPTGTTVSFPVTVTSRESRWNSVAPRRYLETRAGYTTFDGASQPGVPVPAGEVVRVKIAGRGDVPAGVSAVTLNVAAVAPESAGFLTVFPCDVDRPTASTLNYGPDEVVANGAIVQPDANGEICVYAMSTTDVLIDVTGYYPEGAGYQAVTPGRLMETRAGYTTVDGIAEGGGKVTNTDRKLRVTGRAGVPDDAKAVTLNLTSVNSDQTGFVLARTCGSPVTTSVLNTSPGRVVANTATVEPDANGDICLFANMPTDLVVDVIGYHTANSAYTPVGPSRYADTRPATLTFDGNFMGAGKVKAGTTYAVTVAGRGPVPADADAVEVNVTVVNPAEAGYVTVTACGEPTSGTSTLNYLAGEIRANAATVKPGVNGTVCIYAFTDTDVVVDVTGYHGATLVA